MTKDEFKRHMKASVHIGTGQTRKRDKQADSAEIERLTQKFLEDGGKVDQVDIRETKHVDLTFRHYSKAAMEGVR